MSIQGTTGVVVGEEKVVVVSDDSRLQQLARSVGCIRANGVRYATGWVVARNKVVTNSHVANRLVGARVTISFDEMSDRGVEHELRLINRHEDEVPDIAFYEFVSLGDSLPEPIPLARQRSVGVDVTLIGYPLKRFNNVPQDAAFRSLVENLGRRVFSPGRITHGDLSRFSHTCNTLPGCSGSVLIAEDDRELKAIGVHDCGEWIGGDRSCKSLGPVPANLGWWIGPHQL